MAEKNPDFRHRQNLHSVLSPFEAAWHGHLSEANGVDTANRTNFAACVSLPFNNDVFRTVLRILAVRHPILTAVVVGTGLGVRIVKSECPTIFMEVIDGRIHSTEDTSKAAEDILSQHIWHRFDLNGPLSRAVVVIVSETLFVFGVVVHHFICDDISMAVLQSEFRNIYLALLSEKRPTLPPRSLDYFEYLTALEEWYATETYSHRLQYWDETLGPYRCPSRTSITELASMKWCRLPLTVEGDLHRKLRDVSARCQTTMFTVLLAAHFRMLADELGQEDVVVAVISMGRNLPVLRRIVGRITDRIYCKTTLVGRVPCKNDIFMAHEAMMAANRNLFVPSGHIMNALESRGAEISAPVFNFRTVNSSHTPDQEIRWKTIKLPKTEGTSRLGNTVYGYWMEVSNQTNCLNGYIRCADIKAQPFLNRWFEILHKLACVE